MTPDEHNAMRLTLRQADDLASKMASLKNARENLRNSFSTDLATGISSITLEVPKEMRDDLENCLRAMFWGLHNGYERDYKLLTFNPNPQENDHGQKDA